MKGFTVAAVLLSEPLYLPTALNSSVETRTLAGNESTSKISSLRHLSVPTVARNWSPLPYFSVTL